MFELVGNVSLTVNELVGKFNVFQNNVSDWVKNINAKVDILESTVKTIKDNLWPVYLWLWVSIKSIINKTYFK